MTSTRNINTKCNYQLQQKSNRQSLEHNLYKNSSSGVAFKNEFPEFYNRPSYLPRQFYTENSIDIESALKGINTTNLVEEPSPVIPVFKPIKYTCFFEHTNKVQLPEPLVIERNQRPSFN